MGPVLSNSLQDLVADLTDVTLVDEDAKSILTGNANRAIQTPEKIGTSETSDN